MSFGLIGLGIGMGAVVYMTAQAMATPVAQSIPRGTENFVGPMNIQTWQNSASPISSPTVQMTTAEVAPPDYMTGMSNADKVKTLAAQAANAVATNNEAIRQHMMNAADPVVIGPTEQRSVVLSSQYEQNAYAYTLRRNVGAQGASSYLMKGIPGSYAGDQTRPSL